MARANTFLRTMVWARGASEEGEGELSRWKTTSVPRTPGSRRNRIGRNQNNIAWQLAALGEEYLEEEEYDGKEGEGLEEDTLTQYKASSTNLKQTQSQPGNWPTPRSSTTAATSSQDPQRPARKSSRNRERRNQQR
ncbi:hypothetical protein RUND412_007969 [Rhizina undulata]